MSGVVYSNRVIARNNFGQFIRDCEQAANATVLDTVQEGADLAASFAPRRTGRLASSIKPFMLSATSGVWGSGLKYAAAQETGAKRHTITPNVQFFWDKAGRWWIAPEKYWGGDPPFPPINHPGNPGTHYMKQSAAIMRRRMTQIAKTHYPG